MTGNLKLLQTKGRAEENLWAKHSEAEALLALACSISEQAAAPVSSQA